MLASAKENNEATKVVKKSKAIYIMDSIKYDLKDRGAAGSGFQGRGQPQQSDHLN